MSSPRQQIGIGNLTSLAGPALCPMVTGRGQHPIEFGFCRDRAWRRAAIRQLRLAEKNRIVLISIESSGRAQAFGRSLIVEPGDGGLIDFFQT